MNQNDILRFLCTKYAQDKDKFFSVEQIHNEVCPELNIRGTREKISKLFRYGCVVMNGKELIGCFLKGKKAIRRYKIDKRSINSTLQSLGLDSSDISYLGNTNISTEKI